MSSTSSTACAKVLLIGEHSVVYGHGAIALGLPNGLAARASLQPGPDALEVPHWDLACTAEQADTHLVARAFATLLEAFELRGRGVQVHVDARIPAGVGLGSSAALAVALCRALAALTQRELSFDELDALCMRAERVFHGNPSGIDHTVAALGGALWIRRREGQSMLREPLEIGSPVELVVAVAAPGASTKTLVEGVRLRRERQPTVMLPVLEAMGALALRARTCLAQGQLNDLGELMNINHGLLMAIGVSIDALDNACSIARSAGALGAKLTGAGGGGCIVALAPGCQDAVASALRDHGMDVFTPILA